MERRWPGRIVICALIASLLFVSNQLVKVENQRYALIGGMCKGVNDLPDLDCLDHVQTRTSWMWHLYYALGE